MVSYGGGGGRTGSNGDRPAAPKVDDREWQHEPRTHACREAKESTIGPKAEKDKEEMATASTAIDEAENNNSVNVPRFMAQLVL